MCRCPRQHFQHFHPSPDTRHVGEKVFRGFQVSMAHFLCSLSFPQPLESIRGVRHSSPQERSSHCVVILSSRAVYPSVVTNLPPLPVTSGDWHPFFRVPSGDAGELRSDSAHSPGKTAIPRKGAYLHGGGEIPPPHRKHTGRGSFTGKSKQAGGHRPRREQQPQLPGPPEKGGREKVVEDPIPVSQLLPSGREFAVHSL